MAAWQALRARLAESDDALLRRQLLIALASADDDDTAAAARAFALGADVRKGERLRVLFTISSVAGQRRAFWGFLKAELGRIKDGVPEFGHGLVPLLAQGLCDASLVPEVRAAFAPHLSTMVGAPRSLDNAAEAIRICAAVRAHHLR
jgi:hypothetical protein